MRESIGSEVKERNRQRMALDSRLRENDELGGFHYGRSLYTGREDPKRVSTGLARIGYNRCTGTRGFDRSVLEWIAGRGVIALVKPVAVIN